MIKNIILFKISWFMLETLNNFFLNWLYVDTFAKEQVLQQKIDPNSVYSITDNYKMIVFPYSQFETVESIKKDADDLCSIINFQNPTTIWNDDLYEITKINVRNLIEQYERHILVI